MIMTKAIEAGRDYLSRFETHNIKQKVYHEDRMRETADGPYSMRSMSADWYHHGWAWIHGKISGVIVKKIHYALPAMRK